MRTTTSWGVLFFLMLVRCASRIHQRGTRLCGCLFLFVTRKEALLLTARVFWMRR
jgi:hypothetical protein